MADPTPTRQDVVEENIDKVLEENTEDAKLAMIAQCAKDISISLAMLVDNSASSES